MPRRPGRSSLFVLSGSIVLCSALTTVCGAQELRNPLRAAGLDSFDATRQRPLFSPSRRPPAEPPAPVPAAVQVPPALSPAEPAPFLLVGTITGSETRVAIVRIVGTDEVLTLAQGTRRDGWSVRAVEARRLSVEKDGRVEDIALGEALDGDAAIATLAAAPDVADAGETRADVASRAPMQQAADASAGAAPRSLAQ